MHDTTQSSADKALDVRAPAHIQDAATIAQYMRRDVPKPQQPSIRELEEQIAYLQRENLRMSGDLFKALEALEEIDGMAGAAQDALLYCEPRDLEDDLTKICEKAMAFKAVKV